MKLWIRSQDKTFLTIINSGLFIHEHFDPNEKGLYEIQGSYGGALGFYTKERALEILDEIQNKIIQNNKTNEVEYKKIEMIDENRILVLKPGDIFYEMPKK